MTFNSILICQTTATTLYRLPYVAPVQSKTSYQLVRTGNKKGQTTDARGIGRAKAQCW